MLGPDGTLQKLSNFPPLRLPIDPRVEVTGNYYTSWTLMQLTDAVAGILAHSAHIFKSALAPMLLEFVTARSQNYAIIFKKGDDLRQDQFITQVRVISSRCFNLFESNIYPQMITVMDSIWKKAGMDLQLTPYRVLATSRDEGMLQHVPSVTFAKALEESNFDLPRYLHWNLLFNVLTHFFALSSYFVALHRDPDGEYGFSDKILDNFVKSCAGYCVITFILGIGDRHLDNLLLTPQGEQARNAQWILIILNALFQDKYVI
jgi:phosphatidylinositol 3-kinase